MKETSRKLLNIIRGGDLGFIAVVVVSYVSAIATVGYAPRAFTPFSLSLLVGCGLAYLIIGTSGFARVRRTRAQGPAAAYLAVQIILGATIIYLLPSGAIFLIVLPLAGQSVVLLSGVGVAAFCVVIFLMMVAPIWWRGGLVPALIVGMIFLAGLVFVVVFTKIAVREREARGEVQRLANQLGEANLKLREYASQVEELATAKERNRLAREIHDSLGHYLTVLNVQIEAARAVIGDRSKVLDVLEKAQSLTQEGLTEVRRSVAALRSPPAENRPLSETLATLVEDCSAAGNPAELIIRGTPRSLAPQTQLTLYRAAQEGLTNVRKHSQASQVAVTLDYQQADSVRLIIEDNGIGGRANNEGFGLLGVRERAQLLDGEVSIYGVEGGGFVLEVRLPARADDL